jgi:hypothetical protein
VLLVGCSGPEGTGPTLGSSAGADGSVDGGSLADAADTTASGEVAAAETLADGGMLPDQLPPGDAPPVADVPPGELPPTTEVATGGDSTGPDLPAPDVPAPVYTTCPALYSCAQLACGSVGKIGCDAPCVAKASPEATKVWQPFASCVNEACFAKGCGGPGAKGCGDCMGESCFAFMMECMSEGKSGVKECSSLFTCIDTCEKLGGAGAYACIMSCYTEMSEAAQGQMQALQGCLYQAKSSDPMAECAEPLLVCMTGGKSGSDDCIALAKCWEVCEKTGGGDAATLACASGCYAKATPAAQQDFLKATTCLEAAKKSGGDQAPCVASMLSCAKPEGKLACPEIPGCVWKCFQDKGQSYSCAWECLHQASPNGAKAWIEFTLCSDAKCKPGCGEDEKCKQACEDKECASQKAACIAS